MGRTKKKKKHRDEEGRKVVARNRRATRDYEVIDHLEVGMVLEGTEVKSLRAGQVDITDGYAQVISGELWLIGVRISSYASGGYVNHLPERRRKLLAHARQILRLSVKIREKGLTLVPLSIYFLQNGRAKLEIGLARGKRQYGRKEEIAERDRRRDLRALRRSKDADA